MLFGNVISSFRISVKTTLKRVLIMGSLAWFYRQASMGLNLLAKLCLYRDICSTVKEFTASDSQQE